MTNIILINHISAYVKLINHVLHLFFLQVNKSSKPTGDTNKALIAGIAGGAINLADLQVNYYYMYMF